MKKILLPLAVAVVTLATAQNKMTPELLWKLGRVAGLGITKDKQFVVFAVNQPDVQGNTSNSKYYKIPIAGGKTVELDDAVDSILANNKISPDGKYLLTSDEVPVKKVHSSDLYPDLPKANVYVYESLNYRHWDTWEDGKFGHVFFAPLIDGKPGDAKDIMPNEPYDCPQKPSGGGEDYIWNPDSKHILYVTKKKFGTDYAISTNTDLYEYDITTGTTKNLTESNKGYDIAPAYNNKGVLAWLQMKHDGYESDKQDLIVSDGTTSINLTKSRDNIHVEGFKWAEDNKTIYFFAPINGTLQLFSVNYPGSKTKVLPFVKQLTKGEFDITGIVGQKGDTLIVTRTDMNHATELYTVNIGTGELQQLTHVNDGIYKNIGRCKVERKYVTTTDEKKMLVWVIFPPDFDSTKKYPTLLYCQGGPQVSLTQFYSYRWNMQLIASQGYIVVAPCRRGMPGFGTKWNEQVSKDWGGQVIQDYLSAIDAVSKEKYVDINRRGCVGASFGGFSSFALEGAHQGRFKTFIAHDGIFDFKSMFGTTDELFFENWEKGGNYWDKNNAVAQRSFSQSPSNFVDKWNTPILIVQGGKDYRVPIGQGQEAFQAAQLKGIKSKFLYLPDENHWVLSPQNALVWQREFFKWLDETLPVVGK
jgi:dipeptidyl aminopeptidase/acylaminoacyl peptidase